MSIYCDKDLWIHNLSRVVKIVDIKYIRHYTDSLETLHTYAN